MHHTLTVTIAASPATIYPYLVTELAGQWIGGWKSSTPLTEGGVRVGAAFRDVLTEGKREIALTTTILALEQDRMVRFGIEVPGMGTTEAEYVLEARGGGTELRYSAVSRIRGLMRLFAPLMRGSMERRAREDLGRLKALVERASHR